jgi:hypothetical protein
MTAASAISLAFAKRSDVVPDTYHERHPWLQRVSTYLGQPPLPLGSHSAGLQVAEELLENVSKFSRLVLSMLRHSWERTQVVARQLVVVVESLSHAVKV